AAGWLIERSGWKGRRLGPVGMHERQALVMVNHGGASARDIQVLADVIRAEVATRFGVHLEQEPLAMGSAGVSPGRRAPAPCECRRRAAISWPERHACRTGRSPCVPGNGPHECCLARKWRGCWTGG